MPPKRVRTSKSQKTSNRSSGSSSSKSKSDSQSPKALSSAGCLLKCDPPTKQFIKHLDESKPVDKKLILEDLDATHLLVKEKAKDEIMRKVQAWMDENVFSNIDRVGENLET